MHGVPVLETQSTFDMCFLFIKTLFTCNDTSECTDRDTRVVWRYWNLLDMFLRLHQMELLV